MAKPDRRIYEHAVRVIRGSPSATMFVGDGSDNELGGATDAGLMPILLRIDAADAYDSDRAHLETWTGPAISELSELVALLSRAGIRPPS